MSGLSYVDAKSRLFRQAELTFKQLRRTVRRLYGIPAAYPLVFGPRIIEVIWDPFSQHDDVVGTDEEYCGVMTGEFTPEPIRVFSPDRLAKACRSDKPGAALISPVSWKGRVVDLASLAGRIKRASPDTLVVADFAHVGAIGFPAIGQASDVDMVAVDLHKWISRSHVQSGLCAVAFAPSFPIDKIERWYGNLGLSHWAHLDCYSPAGLDKAVWSAIQWLEVVKLSGLSRPMMRHTHVRNLRLAQRVADHFGVPYQGSAIVWLESQPLEDPLMDQLAHLGLVWFCKDGSRIMCRADVLESGLPQESITY